MPSRRGIISGVYARAAGPRTMYKPAPAGAEVVRLRRNSARFCYDRYRFSVRRSDRATGRTDGTCFRERFAVVTTDNGAGDSFFFLNRWPRFISLPKD